MLYGCCWVSHAVVCLVLGRIASVGESSAWNLNLLTEEVPEQRARQIDRQTDGRIIQTDRQTHIH